MDTLIARLRAETPGCARIIHLNNAGAALPATPVLDAVRAHLALEAEIGPMEAGERMADGFAALYPLAARLLGAQTDEIALTDSVTRGWQHAFASLPLEPGARLLTHRGEWAGNLASLHRKAAEIGGSVEVIPSAEDGTVSLSGLEAMIDDRVGLIALTWAPANGGLLNDAAGVGRVARAAGIPYLIDAAQVVGQLPVDVAALHCDFLACNGRKHLRAPRGTGLLYVGRAIRSRIEPPHVDAWSAPWPEQRPRPDARAFEATESAAAMRLGLAIAITHALDLGLDWIADRVGRLADRARASLGTLPGVTVHDLGTIRTGLVSFSVDGIAPQDLRRRLAAEGINLGANGRTYTPLDLIARNLGDLMRLSPSYYNTEDEIDRAVEAVGRHARH